MLKTPSSTVIGGAGIWTPSAWKIGLDVLNLGQLIRNLFANSEQGFTQTLDDYSILFQDAAGTTSVTGAGQTLGLVLDKSKGLVLGSELNSNNFNTDLSGWFVGSSITASIVNGQARCVFAGTMSYANTRWFALNLNAVISKRYRIEFDATYISGGGSLEVGGSVFPVKTITSSSNAGIKTHYIVDYSIAYSSSPGLAVFGGTVAGSTWDIDNVSVKEVKGNHAYQFTSSMRPLLQNTPRRIQYDGIDDKLTTTLPAQLTGCTVIRAIPNVGCQILTNQTIPTPYKDSTSHCGLIVINRALTAYETSLVTQIFNKLAGV